MAEFEAFFQDLDDLDKLSDPKIVDLCQETEKLGEIFNAAFYSIKITNRFLDNSFSLLDPNKNLDPNKKSYFLYKSAKLINKALDNKSQISTILEEQGVEEKYKTEIKKIFNEIEESRVVAYHLLKSANMGSLKAIQELKKPKYQEFLQERKNETLFLTQDFYAQSNLSDKCKTQKRYGDSYYWLQKVKINPRADKKTVSKAEELSTRLKLNISTPKKNKKSTQ